MPCGDEGGGEQTTDPEPAQDGTPVGEHGKLHVCGAAMCDEQNSPVQPQGVSSMWLHRQSQPYAQNLQALEWMRDNWNLEVFRVAMGVEPEGSYLDDPNRWKSEVDTVINNAASAGVYVIVDEAVVAAIREHDPDNIVVLGTPSWSQKVDTAAGDPVAGTNLMYTLHFYSCTHTSWLRDNADAAMDAGIALFVTEWGASAADGGIDGQVCLDEAQRWTDWMAANGISWTAWKLDVGTDSTNLLSAGAPVTGGWDGHLQGHAPFVIEQMN